MKSKAKLGKYSDQLLVQLGVANDNELINAKQAARIIGISLRTMRYREADNKTPQRIAGKGSALLYRLGDIRAYAKRYQQEQALKALSFGPDDIEFIFSFRPSKLKTTFIQYGLHPSLWP
jgi:hypothetical protein